MIPNSVNANAPAFQAAQAACSKLLPAGGGPDDAPSEDAHRAMFTVGAASAPTVCVHLGPARSSLG